VVCRFYIITDGEVAVTRGVSPVEAAASPASLIVPGDAGPEFVITHLYEGHFFGETALVNDAPRNANVRVMHGEVRVMVMSKDAFKPFLDQDPKFRKMIGELVLKKEETARKRTEMLKVSPRGGRWRLFAQPPEFCCHAHLFCAPLSLRTRGCRPRAARL